MFDPPYHDLSQALTLIKQSPLPIPTQTVCSCLRPMVNCSQKPIHIWLVPLWYTGFSDSSDGIA